MTNTKVLWITIWLTIDYVTFYKIEFTEKHAPEVTECIKIDKELHVKLFSKAAQFLYHSGFAKALIAV